jgi:hypothetical protein
MQTVSVTIWQGHMAPLGYGDGVYTFNIQVDDGTILYVNNTMVIDQIGRYAYLGWVSGSIYLLGNMYYEFALTYANYGGGGAVMFTFNPPNSPNTNLLVNVTN